MQLGFLGLGRMGKVMARRLLDHGHALAVYNRSSGPADALAAAGARVAVSITDATSSCDIAITMLADDVALEQIAGELVAALAAGAIHVAMGTHSVATITALASAHAAHGQTLVAAPMLGRPEAVADGRAAIVAAGPPTAIAICAGIFSSLGRRTFDAGEAAQNASGVKIANNFLLACAIEAMGEAFSLVEKIGVRPDLFEAVIKDGMFASPAYAAYSGLIARQAFDEVGFAATLGLKDVRLALSAGEHAGVPLPSGNVVRDRLIGALGRGEGDLDWAVMAREQARAAGLI